MNFVDSSNSVECWWVDGSAPWRLSQVFVCALLSIDGTISLECSMLCLTVSRVIQSCFSLNSHITVQLQIPGVNKSGANSNKGCEFLSRQKHCSKVRKGNKF